MRLEMKHRKEEDDLYRKFARQREQEEMKMKEEFRVRRRDRRIDLAMDLFVCFFMCGGDLAHQKRAL